MDVTLAGQLVDGTRVSVFRWSDDVVFCHTTEERHAAAEAWLDDDVQHELRVQFLGVGLYDTHTTPEMHVSKLDNNLFFYAFMLPSEPLVAHEYDDMPLAALQRVVHGPKGGDDPSAVAILHRVGPDGDAYMVTELGETYPLHDALHIVQHGGAALTMPPIFATATAPTGHWSLLTADGEWGDVDVVVQPGRTGRRAVIEEMMINKYTSGQFAGRLPLRTFRQMVREYYYPDVPPDLNMLLTRRLDPHAWLTARGLPSDDGTVRLWLALLEFHRRVPVAYDPAAATRNLGIGGLDLPPGSGRYIPKDGWGRPPLAHAHLTAIQQQLLRPMRDSPADQPPVGDLDKGLVPGTPDARLRQFALFMLFQEHGLGFELCLDIEW